MRFTKACCWVVWFALMPGCQSGTSPRSLAEKHCSSCHLFPEPGMLPKNTWGENVLPEMAFRMGLDLSRLPRANPDEVTEILLSLPSSPLISEAEWEQIKAYYIEQAPDSLRTPKSDASELRQFQAAKVLLPIGASTWLTVLEYDSIAKKIFAGSREGKLFQLSPSLKVEDSIELGSPPSAIVFDGKRMLATAMGIMDPNDQPAGSVVELEWTQRFQNVLIDSLKRPVDLVHADLNDDGARDLLVSAFGNFTGGLYAYEAERPGFREHLLHHFAGNRKCVVQDFNNDGLADIMALITQGDERIALFTNRGDFRFSYQVLLKFPPAYGSSYFELSDLDKDGDQDILYTNGDNADYSPVLKPYHGIRIFTNDGRNHFKETWFHPMHGASRAHAVDFDHDGDLDIAAISFFPDFKHHPEQSFLYFENQNGNLMAHSTPAAASGRWITMECEDIDSDGDTDIILGALNFPTGVPEGLLKKWEEETVSLLVLKNVER